MVLRVQSIPINLVREIIFKGAFPINVCSGTMQSTTKGAYGIKRDWNNVKT